MFQEHIPLWFMFLMKGRGGHSHEAGFQHTRGCEVHVVTTGHLRAAHGGLGRTSDLLPQSSCLMKT